MKIDFISDVACPWCAIGMSSLEQAIERIGSAAEIEVNFQPFELNPNMGPEGQDLEEHLSGKYGVSVAQMAITRDTIKQRGEELGFTFTTGARSRVYNTFDAHRLLHWANLKEGRFQRDLKLALFIAYFTDGRDVSDHEVLVSCAVAAKLDAELTRQVLASGQYAAEVRAAERHWQGLGINSVPAIIIDEKHLIQGGQPPDVFERALRQPLGAA